MGDKQAMHLLDTMLARHTDLLPLREVMVQAYGLLRDCFAGGGKLLVCGNGGSAADSEHIVGELMKGFLKKRPVSPAEKALFALQPDADYLTKNLQGALPAISLCAHTGLQTAFANDAAADLAFAQQVWGYGKAGDVLLALSTSGNSANVVYALQTAAAKDMRTIGITGRDGGKVKTLCTVALCTPQTETYAVQESTLPLYHILCAMAEAAFFEE